MNRYVRDFGLGIVLAILFIASWIAHTLSGWVEFVAEQQSRGEAAEIFGPSGYVWPWIASTMENWQSEFLQLFTMVVLTAFLIHRGSTESRDGDDELLLQISVIRRELADLEGEVHEVSREDDRALLDEAEELSHEVEGALNMMLEDQVQSAWKMNTLIWAGTVVGAFLLNLLLLIVIGGG